MRLSILAMLAFFLMGATGSSLWVPMDDVGCEVIMGFGRDATTNMTDRCPLDGTQEGNNSSDFTLKFDAIANFDSNPPPGRHPDTEVFDFDGVDDYLELGVADLYEDEIGEPTTFLGWIAPDSIADTYVNVYMNYDGISPLGENGMKIMVHDELSGSLYQARMIVEQTVANHTTFLDVELGNAWTMVGGSYSEAANTMSPYSSRCATDTMLCVSGVTETNGLQGVSLPYAIAGDESKTRELVGQMSEIFLFEIPLTSEQACQICRSGYSNDPGNPNEPDDVIWDRAAYCATRVTALGCTLPNIPGSSTPATHVGPRRIM